jgi:hypothetical protein
MQSYPHMSTMDKLVTDELEKHPQSLTIDFHNKCKTHERRLATYVRENFRASDSCLKVYKKKSDIRHSNARLLTMIRYRIGSTLPNCYNRKQCTTPTAPGAANGAATALGDAGERWSGK